MSKRTEDLEKQITNLRVKQLQHKIAAGASRVRLDMKTTNLHMQRVAELQKKIDERLDWIKELGA
jgi:hypothetical protein